MMPRILACLLLFSSPVVAGDSPGQPDGTALQRSVDELRDSIGAWRVTTEFLADDGSVARSVPGTYEFEWVIEDRLISGRNAIPGLQQSSAILFYIRESDQSIEMVAVGADGRLWVMTGELGGNTRYTQTIETDDGGTLQLRFTRYNVSDNGFESRMERSIDGGRSWLPGNRQVFTRQNKPASSGTPAPDDNLY